jgi:hypothetical protein
MDQAHGGQYGFDVFPHVQQDDQSEQVEHAVDLDVEDYDLDGGSEDEAAARHGRRVRPRIDPLRGHEYLIFDRAHPSFEKCEKLRTMEVLGHDAIDWDFLQEIGAADRARAIIGQDTPWSRLFAMMELPTYRELTVEFLSTFVYQRRTPETPAGVPEVSFRLRGVWREMSLREFSVRVGLYTDEESRTELYVEDRTIEPRQTLVSFYRFIATDPFGATQGKATEIVDPLYRCCHRLIASSVAARGCRDKVNMSDLFFLYCLLLRRPCSLGTGMAQYFQGVYTRQERGQLYGGPYVTQIARSFDGYRPELDLNLGPSIDCLRMGKAKLISMGIVKRVPRTTGPYRLVRHRTHIIYEPVDLPPWDQIPVYLEGQEEEQQEGQVPGAAPAADAPQPAHQEPHVPQFPIHVQSDHEARVEAFIGRVDGELAHLHAEHAHLRGELAHLRGELASVLQLVQLLVQGQGGGGGVVGGGADGGQ